MELLVSFCCSLRFSLSFVCVDVLVISFVSHGLGPHFEVLESIHWFPCAHSGGFGEDMAVR